MVTIKVVIRLTNLKCDGTLSEDDDGKHIPLMSFTRPTITARNDIDDTNQSNQIFRIWHKFNALWSTTNKFKTYRGLFIHMFGIFKTSERSIRDNDCTGLAWDVQWKITNFCVGLMTYSQVNWSTTFASKLEDACAKSWVIELNIVMYNSRVTNMGILFISQFNDFGSFFWGYNVHYAQSECKNSNQ